MRPLSDAITKPALPLPGGPVIVWALRLAATTGASSITVNSWWLAEQLEAAAREAAPAETQCCFSREDELMETAGGLALARDRGLLGKEGSVLVINGDGVLNLDLDPLFVHHRASGDLVTLALLPHLAPDRWSRVLLDHDGRVTKILPPGQPSPGEAPFLYPGVMLVSRPALDSLQARPGGVAGELWQPAREAGRLGGVVVSGHWREVGCPKDYLDAVVALVRNESCCFQGATIHPGATVMSALIGKDVVIEAGARITHSVVSHGAIVQEGALVERSVVLGDVVVPVNSCLVDECLVGTIPGVGDKP